MTQGHSAPPAGGGVPGVVTVAICTHDRARLLESALASLAELEVPPDVAWEVVVVANACTDETPDVLRSWEERLPLRHVEEPRRGHSHARNRAVAEADGDLIVWTDDDVVVDPGWLQAYVEACRRWPGAAFYGGPIRPDFEGVPPDWLVRAYDACEAVRAAYAERDLGTEPVEICTPERLPFGANMALRSDSQRRHAFDPRLGRSGNDLVGGDELAVLRALLDEEETGRWVPDARVAHLVPTERQTVDYLRRYFRDQGRVADPLPEDLPVPTLFGRPRWAFRAWVEEEAKYRFRRVSSPPPVWVPHLIEASFAKGALQGKPEEAHHRG